MADESGIYRGDVAPKDSAVSADDENETEVSCGHFEQMYDVPLPQEGDICCDVDKRKVGKFVAKVCLLIYLFLFCLPNLLLLCVRLCLPNLLLLCVRPCSFRFYLFCVLQ